jgi:short-subunit dehydrogenase
MVRSDVVVITGASSGIGRTTARLLASRGSRLVLVARGRAALDEVANECRALGGEAQTHVADVTDAEAMLDVASEAVATFGRLDVWVNVAAVASYGRFAELPLDEVRRVLDVNVMGYANGCHAALRVMSRRGSGVIVNVASIVGKVPQPFSAPYAMSKAAVLALGVSLRSELALERKGIHVVTIVPPTIDTPFFGHAANHTEVELVALPPVYPPELVAHAILAAVRHPERGERTLGVLGRGLVAIHRLNPRLANGIMAVQTAWGQFGRTPAPSSAGNLFASGSFAEATGGWHGRRRRNVRVALALASAAALVVSAGRSRSRRR